VIGQADAGQETVYLDLTAIDTSMAIKSSVGGFVVPVGSYETLYKASTIDNLRLQRFGATFNVRREVSGTTQVAFIFNSNDQDD
jgi:hypothetical protein